MKFLLSMVVFAGCIQVTFGQQIEIEKLTCEYIENPLGIDMHEPVLGWVLHSAVNNQSQSAYEIIVSDAPDKIYKNEGNIWQSGKIQSSESNNIIYAGKSLQSFTRYYWSVRVYDKTKKPSLWSKVAWFETAMLLQSDWKAKWISDGKPVPAKNEDFYKEDAMPLFKKQVAIKKKIASARLYIAGAGYYEAYINGEKIGNDVLQPGWTHFDKRILYRTYDITTQIKQGENTVGIILGNGWYNPLPLKMWGVYNVRDVLPVGRPAAKAQIVIRYNDGSKETIITDESWATKPGPILKNSVYLGEAFDARKEWSNWFRNAKETNNAATITNGPKGVLEADVQPPVKITTIVKPVRIVKTNDGKFMVDMGQNFAGVASIKIKAQAGVKILLRYGEDIYKDGSLNGMTAVAGQIKNGNGSAGAPQIAWQQDSYITNGKGEEKWHPRFTFHVFRYIEVTGWPGELRADDINGLRMNADVPDAGVFECSNPLLNQIQKNILWTFKSNIFSVQSDCAGREKFGYGGDLFCTTESFCYNFDMVNFYRKVLQDFADAQRLKGGFTETAPYVGLHDKSPGDDSGPLGWQLGVSYLVKKLYDFYGDKKIIEKYYPALEQQINFLMDSATGNLYYHDISDHESLDPKPEALTASLFYYHHVLLMQEFSQLLHKTNEANKYGSLAEKIKQSFNKKFYKGNGVYDNGTQAAQIFPLWYNMVSDKEKGLVIKQLESAFTQKNNHISTGIFATKMMFDVLRINNKEQLAYTIASQQDFPGWGYMVSQGATTIWETWKYSDNVYSQNHPMFGSITEWFYRSLLGINATSPGFKTFRIQPQPAPGLSYAKGTYTSLYGAIGSEWKISQNQLELKVQVPVNTTAEIWLPTSTGAITVDGKPVMQNKQCAQFVKKENNYTIYKVGSGKYLFSTTL